MKLGAEQSRGRVESLCLSILQSLVMKKEKQDATICHHSNESSIFVYAYASCFVYSSTKTCLPVVRGNALHCDQGIYSVEFRALYSMHRSPVTKRIVQDFASL